MRTTLINPLRALLLTAAVAGCGGQRISGAVYAGQVPVYPGATFETASRGSYTDSAGRPPSLESQSWFYKIRDSIPRVADYYQHHLPDAKRDDGDDGTVTFSFVPKGAESGEGVSVTIRPGELQIAETTKPGKRKA